MQENDANAKTIKSYLKKLLKLVWSEEQGFNGKRPFGNSGWQYEVYIALVKAELVDGTFDEWEEVEVDEREADKLILEAIKSL